MLITKFSQINGGINGSKDKVRKYCENCGTAFEVSRRVAHQKIYCDTCLQEMQRERNKERRQRTRNVASLWQKLAMSWYLLAIVGSWMTGLGLKSQKSAVVVGSQQCKSYVLEL